MRDDFVGDRLDPENWSPQMRSRKGEERWVYPSPVATWMAPAQSAIGAAGSFNAEFYSPDQVSVRDGVLELVCEPVRDLGPGEEGYACRSGVVSSYGKALELDRGTLTVTAQLPDVAGGAWPAIWLMTGSGAGEARDVNEVDLHEGGFLPEAVGLPDVDPNRIAVSHYHSGEHPDTVEHRAAIELPFDLSAGFHDFRVRYLPGESITTWVDDIQVGHFTTDIGTEPYCLILNLAHAGDTALDWHTTGAPARSAMRVASVVIDPEA